MVKTISIPEDLHKELMQLRIQKGSKNAADLIKEMLYEYKQKKFMEASNLFKQKLKDKDMPFKDFLKRSRKVKTEISNEFS